METIIIRDARLEDAGRMAEIYEHYVKNTAVSFEYEVPTLEEFQNRMKKTMERYPYLAAEREGVVEGYAYAGPFVGRKAYGWSCELTIYLDKDIQKRGIGRRLYEALTEKLKDMGVTNVYACVGTVQGEDPYLTLNSAQFHEHMDSARSERFAAAAINLTAGMTWSDGKNHWRTRLSSASRHAVPADGRISVRGYRAAGTKNEKRQS